MFYTINEIAEMTKLSTRTIRRYIDYGTLKGKKIGGQWRFSESEYYEFLDNSDFSDKSQRMTESVAKEYINKADISDEELDSTCFIVLFISFENETLLVQTKEKILELFNLHFSEKDNHLKLAKLSTSTLKVTYNGNYDFILKINHFFSKQ